jgi:hypothetical protein
MPLFHLHPEVGCEPLITANDNPSAQNMIYMPKEVGKYYPL